MSRLSPERWRALGPYLDDALEIPTEERPTWLASLGVRDASLAADVRALLEEHDALHQSRFLEKVAPHPHKSSAADLDRKSTRLNSSHVAISYAVFCLK